MIHLGDYIYEYANGDYGWGQSIGRIPLPDRTIFTLYDYRKRIATYRTDLDLLLSHQTFPWIPVWDDHEVADNTYRDGSSGTQISERSIFFLFRSRCASSDFSLKREWAVGLLMLPSTVLKIEPVSWIMLILQTLSELNNTEASFIGDGGVSVDQRKMNAVRAYVRICGVTISSFGQSFES